MSGLPCRRNQIFGRKPLLPSHVLRVKFNSVDAEKKPFLWVECSSRKYLQPIAIDLCLIRRFPRPTYSKSGMDADTVLGYDVSVVTTLVSVDRS